MRNSLIQAMSSSSQDTAALLGGQYRGRVDEDGTPLMESSLSHTLRESISRRESFSTQLPMGTGAAGALGTKVCQFRLSLQVISQFQLCL